MRQAIFLAALCAALAACAAADARTAAFQNALNNALISVGQPGGKGATAGYKGGMQHLCVKEATYCATAGPVFGSALRGYNWVNTLTCCPGPHDDYEERDGTFEPKDGPIIGWCYMDSKNYINLPTPPPGTAIHDKFSGTCVFSDGHNSCAGGLAGSTLTLSGLSLYAENVVSPVKPWLVAPTVQCEAGIPDLRLADPEEERKMQEGTGAAQVPPKADTSKGAATVAAAAAAAAEAQVHAAAAAARPAYGYEHAHNATFYRSLRRTSVLFGSAVLYNKQAETVKTGWFNYMWTWPIQFRDDGTNRPLFEELTAAEVAERNLAIMMPFELTLAFPEDKEEYSKH